MKNTKKILFLLVGGLLLPDVSYGSSDIVYYNMEDLDKVITEAGMDYDRAEVLERKKDHLEGLLEGEDEVNLKESPSDEEEVLDNGEEEIVNEIPKVEVYDKVVDISEYQNPVAIDYDALSSEIVGAIIRTSIREKDTTLSKDKEIEKHYEELNKRNVPIGFYHYSRAVNRLEALEEADFVLNIIRNKNVSLPVYIDIEDNDRQAKASREDISEVADAFSMAMRRNGFVGGIYSYPYFADTYLSEEVREENEFWIADWNGKARSSYNTTSYDSWQYSSKGGIKGYNYDIDKSILFRDYPLMIKGTSKNAYLKIAREVIEGKWGNGKARRKALTYAGYDYTIVQAMVDKLIKADKI